MFFFLAADAFVIFLCFVGAPMPPPRCYLNQFLLSIARNYSICDDHVLTFDVGGNGFFLPPCKFDTGYDKCRKMGS